MNSQPVLTQDFTTDQSGRILSMTYDTTGEGYDGDIYFHYDHFGNTTLLTDTNGSPVFSAQYNPCRGTTLQTWNTNNLEIINLGQGRSGTISLDLNSNITALASSSGSIAISNDNFSSFLSKFGNRTDLVCYIFADDKGLRKNWEVPCECQDIKDMKNKKSMIHPEDTFKNCWETEWDYRYYECMLRYAFHLSDDEKAHIARQMRYAGRCAIIKGCKWAKKSDGKPNWSLLENGLIMYWLIKPTRQTTAGHIIGCPDPEKI